MVQSTQEVRFIYFNSACSNTSTIIHKLAFPNHKKEREKKSTDALVIHHFLTEKALTKETKISHIVIIYTNRGTDRVVN